MATFGERIRELRKLQDMKQSELADILHVSKYTVSVWERDIRKPEFSTLETICDVFNVKLNYLLGASEDDSPPAMPTDEDIVEISEADNLEMVKHIARTFSRLSVRSQRIVAAAIREAYRQDKEAGLLQFGCSIEAHPFVSETLGESEDMLIAKEKSEA